MKVVNYFANYFVKVLSVEKVCNATLPHYQSITACNQRRFQVSTVYQKSLSLIAVSLEI